MIPCKFKYPNQTKPCPFKGLEEFKGFCAEHFEFIFIKLKLRKRAELLTELSDLDTQIAEANKKLLVSQHPDVRFSILERCICGFATESFISLQEHLAISNPKEHEHESRWTLPPLVVKTSKRPLTIDPTKLG